VIVPEPVPSCEVDPGRLSRSYESLRESVLARPRLPGAGAAEAIVVRRGLAAWIDSPATAGVMPSRAAVPEHHETASLPRGVHEQLLSVLVNLVLGASPLQESRP
jgi:hypothetical protein